MAEGEDELVRLVNEVLNFIGMIDTLAAETLSSNVHRFQVTYSTNLGVFLYFSGHLSDRLVKTDLSK